MSNPQVPRSRPPRKKLKMPIFGNMVNSGASNEYKEDPIFSNKWVIRGVIIVIFLSFVLPYYFPKFFGGRKIYDSKSEIKELALDGVIRKKYYDSNNPRKIHRFLVVVNKDGTKPMIDLYKNDSAFFENVAVPYRIYKESGSLDVRISRFNLSDTTITLQVD